MTHGSLFSGIGGFDLAAQWMGWENLFHCEWNPFGQKVLKHYWPNAESFDDITKTNFSKYANKIDVLSGGFPCQPYSVAGKRKGSTDERHLWPQMLRSISEISPRYIVGENVRGLVNWNGGMVFNEICSDLENIGYSVAAYIIPACATNAPHRRERIWIVANAERIGFKCGEQQKQSRCQTGIFEGIRNNGIVADTNGERLEGGAHNRTIGEIREKSHEQPTGRIQPTWEKFPIESPVCVGNDGVPPGLDGITFPKFRKESIKAAGNAIVPNVAYEIFKAIELFDSKKNIKIY